MISDFFKPRSSVKRESTALASTERTKNQSSSAVEFEGKRQRLCVYPIDQKFDDDETKIDISNIRCLNL